MSHPCPRWYRIYFTNAKTHLVPGSLREALLSDMEKRGCVPNIQLAEDLARNDESESKNPVARTKRFGLDGGGMIHMDEPWVTLRIFNLDLEIRCVEVQMFLAEAQRYQERYFLGKVPYFKNHSHWHCAVFTPVQQEEFIRQMKKALPEAQAKAYEFFSTHLTPHQVLEELQGLQKAGGARVSERSWTDSYARTNDATKN